jgi:large subunit ribosomal protein L6
MIEIPEGYEVRVEPASIVVKGPKATLSAPYNPLHCRVSLEGRSLKVEPKGRARRRNRAVAGAVEAHVENLLSGTKGEFEKRLTVVYAHFPLSLEVKGREVLLKNFLGEKTPRRALILGEATKVSVQGSEVVVKGPDRYAVGQTASNLWRAARPHNKDIRVFQDGLYLVK